MRALRPLRTRRKVMNVSLSPVPADAIERPVVRSGAAEVYGHFLDGTRKFPERELLKPIGQPADAQRVEMRAVVVEDRFVVRVHEKAVATDVDEAGCEIARRQRRS